MCKIGHFDFDCFRAHQQSDKLVDHEGMCPDQNFIVWLEENMTEQLDNLVGSISQNELGRIEIMVLGRF